ncbi:MAG: MFS transporter [Planctomycetes bacterium]|nr:MFS transporter [Planctomycetota bacterium]
MSLRFAQSSTVQLNSIRLNSAMYGVKYALGYYSIPYQKEHLSYYQLIMKLLSPHFPFSPKKSPLFYGWVIAFAGTLGVITSIPGQTMGVSAFNEDLLSVLPISRSWLSHAYLGGTLASGLLLPYAGKIYDRLGDRLMGILASFCLGVTLLVFSQVDDLATLLGGEMIGTFFLLLLLFFMLRFSGQGILTMVSRTMISKWFQRRRGLVNGCSGLFVSFAFGLAPQFLFYCVSQYGWRNSWVGLGLFASMIMSFLCWLLYRSTPESCDLRMDGAPARTQLGDDEDSVDEGIESFDWSQAKKASAFWGVCLALFSQALVITALTFHLEALAMGQGLSGQEAFAIFFPISIIATLVGFLGGWYCDHWPVHWLVMLMMTCLGIGCFQTSNLASPMGYWSLVFCLGISGGLFCPLSSVALPNYFGRKYIGAISGHCMSLVVIGSSLGPSFLALTLKGSGDFSLGFKILSILPLSVFVLGLFMRVPRKFS